MTSCFLWNCEVLDSYEIDYSGTPEFLKQCAICRCGFPSQLHYARAIALLDGVRDLC